MSDKIKDWINENFIPINGSQQYALIHEFVGHGIHFNYNNPKNKKEKFSNYIKVTKNMTPQWREFIHSTFEEAGLVPNNNKYKMNVLQQSLERKGLSIMINCSVRKVQDKKYVEMIDEIRICLNSDLEVIPCTGEQSLITNCGEFAFFYPIRRKKSLIML